MVQSYQEFGSRRIGGIRLDLPLSGKVASFSGLEMHLLLTDQDIPGNSWKPSLTLRQSGQ